MSTMLDKTIRWYIVMGAFLYLILFTYHGDGCLNVYNAFNIYTFASYALILWKSSSWADQHFTTRNLGVTVFVFSAVFVTLCLLLSDYYRGNTFMFTEADSIAYYRYSHAILDRPMDQWLPFLTKQRWYYDDWGAPIALTLMFHIIDSKLFVNFCYVIINTVAAISLFQIGKVIMTARYSYLAAITYAISSYSLFFMSCFLKEEMLVFVVITSYYMLYMYMKNGRIGYLVMGGLVSSFILFFRPPLIVFIGMAYMMMLLFKTKNGHLRYLVIVIIVVASVAAIGLVQYSADKYANGGNLSESYHYVNTSSFQKVVLYVGAFFGPFPQLLQMDDKNTYKPLMAAGLLLKLLLDYPFWRGLWYAIKCKHKEVIPIYTFVVLEMLGLAISLDGLELRKAMPHVALFIVAAFWYFDQYDNEIDETVIKLKSYVLSGRLFNACLLVVFFAVLIWNTLKV